MRKHDVRKWLHAILDLLPVILIPVFMIYSHRHTIDSGSIQVFQNEVVDFNQQVKNGNFSSFDNWRVISDEYVSIELVNGACLEVINDGENSNWQYGIYQILDDIKLDNVYLFKVSSSTTSSLTQLTIELGGANNVNINIGSNQSVIVNPTINYNNQLLFYPVSAPNVNDTFTFDNLQLFNLTQMFGVGNEPTIIQFNQWYDELYYEYTLSHKELLKGASTITFDDTDIMSQATYQLYNAVDKYFNVGNVFHLGEVYDWFNLNIFNGNAPISVYIVYQIILYELVMDLLFLLYALFMWFIDMIQKLMEKPLNSIK